MFKDDDDRPGQADDEDFAAMFEESVKPTAYSEGDLVQGKIVAVHAEFAFVDVGAKGEATIDIEELRDPDGELDVQVGDVVNAVVVSTQGGLRLSYKLARGAVDRERLADAHSAGIPVEGRVEKAIKGGFDVRLGGERAFCPISQIDTGFTDDPSIHEGKVYTFKIVEFREGKDLVVSRRAILEEEEREVAEEVRLTLVPGAEVPGRVASLKPYGAFVDLGGGIQGLLHVSEMGWSRVSDPADIVRVGDEIVVKVLRLDDDKGKISLGLKQLQADPWSTAGDTYEVGQVLLGRLTRVTDFGAFVELEPGIEGLAHESTFPPSGRPGEWKAALKTGTTVPVELLSVDFERKRIGVAIVPEGSSRAGAALVPDRVQVVEGARLTGKVERHEAFGVFVFLAPGRTGLIPLAETGVDRGTDLRKAFPVGSDIEVIVLEVEPGGRRIRLSRKAVFEAQERNDARDYSERQDSAQGGSFGSLADQLRAAMKKDKD